MLIYYIDNKSSQVLLTSGRVKEGEEAVNAGNDKELDFEFKEDIDQYDLTHIELNSWVNEAVAKKVAEFKEYLMEWSIPEIVNRIAKSVIQGVEEAIIETNSKMHRSDKPAEISKLNLEMFLILKFIDIILVPNLR